VETKAGHFDLDKFEDRYEDALKELLRKKRHGEKIERPKERAPTNVVNLMDALRKSVEEVFAAKRPVSPMCERFCCKSLCLFRRGVIRLV
jgi:non-homologous end joining protein Ku